MRTCNYQNPKLWRARGLVGVGISVSAPRWFSGPVISEFAPAEQHLRKWKAGRMSNDEYARLYAAMVDQLDWDHLLARVRTIESRWNAEAVMLCWCKLTGGPSDFCHRVLWAREAERRWGIVVPEMTLAPTSQIDLFETAA